MRLLKIILSLGLILAATLAHAQTTKKGTMYRSPGCDCCENYAKYLRENGYDIAIVDEKDMDALKKDKGLPKRLEGCHTTIIDGYVVEGHVPVFAINRLLKEHPKIKGISLPGMPHGSPGMSGSKSQTFVIYEIDGDGTKVFATE